MGIRERRVLLSTAILALLPAPQPAEAQAFFLDVALDQGYASDPLPSPFGFSVAMGRTSMLGPLGIHAGYRTLYEEGADEIAQHCGFASCTPGPFEQSYSMRLVYLGLSYDFPNPTDVYLNLGLNVGRNQQTEHLTHVDSGSKIEMGPADETTLGGSVDLRLRPLLGPLRPAFSARYDRIFESDCVADGICLPGRDVWSLSVGLSWVAPQR